MNRKEKINIRLGIFITLGLIIFIAAVYYIGSQQNLFGNTTRITAIFSNVGGLQVGNNVRFSGINIGTVDGIRIISDTTVQVSMVIDDEVSKYIKKDSEASIGSEGLMGNKIITISSGSSGVASIEDDDQLSTVQAAEIDEVIRTMQETGEYAKVVMANFAAITENLKNGKGTLGRLLSDTVMVDKLDEMFVSFQETTNNVVGITDDFAMVSSRIRNGEGTLGQLIMDPQMAAQINSIVDSLQYASSKSVQVIENIEAFSGKLNNNESVLGKVLTDTAMAENIETTILKAQGAAEGVETTTDKINNSWLFNIFTGSSRKKK